MLDEGCLVSAVGTEQDEIDRPEGSLGILPEAETRNPLAVSLGHEPGALSALPFAPSSGMAIRRAPTGVVRRVVVVSAFEEGFGGGSGFATYGLAHRLAERCDTAIVCPGNATGMVDDETPLKRITVTSVEQGQAFYPLLDRTHVDLLFGLLDRFRPDVVHAHDSIQLGMLAQLWAAIRHVPFVLTFHLLPGRELEFGFGDRIRALNGYLVRPLIWHYLRSFYRHCDGGIMMHGAVERLLGEGPRPSRMYKVSSALDLRRFEACRPASTSDAERRLCFVGFLSDRKNQLYLLKMMERLPKNYRLLLVGEALRTDYYDRLRKYAREAGLDNVEFAGRVSHDDIAGVLEQSHVFVSASRLEVQATVINEALASGTPVVALDNETLDLVDESVGYHLGKNAPPAEFARCVKSICDLPQPAYEAMCRRARERVKEMDWSAVLEQHLGAYEEILAEYARGGNGSGKWDKPAETWARFYARLTMDVSSTMYHLNARRLPWLARAQKTPAAY